MTERTRSSRPSLAHAALAVAVLTALGCGAADFAAAQPAPGKAPVDGSAATAWTALTPAQQSALEPLKRDWPGIDTPRRQKWLEIAARMPAMSADERQRIQQRMAEWARLSPEERGRTRLQFQEARQISPQERQALWDAYMALPADERRALANSAKTVPQVGKDATAAAAQAPQARSGTAATVPSATTPKAVAPTVVQAKPGASTTLISKTAEPPPHAQAGQPKIAASHDVVDRRTLLPQAGPQAAAPPVASAQVAPPPAASLPVASPPAVTPQPGTSQAASPPAEATPPGQR